VKEPWAGSAGQRKAHVVAVVCCALFCYLHPWLLFNLKYAQANLDTKGKALERLEASSKTSRSPRWKHDASVLAWLDTL
jgi:hypothetical protein